MKYSYLHAALDFRVADLAKSNVDLKMFRAQRNYYISGLTLFLWV